MISQVLPWIVWALLCFFAVGWSLPFFPPRRGKGISYAILHTVIVWWALLSWTLLSSHINKLHLLWLAPSVIPVATILMFSRFPYPPRSHSGNLLFLLAIYIGILWWLTPEVSLEKTTIFFPLKWERSMLVDGLPLLIGIIIGVCCIRIYEALGKDPYKLSANPPSFLYMFLLCFSLSFMVSGFIGLWGYSPVIALIAPFGCFYIVSVFARGIVRLLPFLTPRQDEK